MKTQREKHEREEEYPGLQKLGETVTWSGNKEDGSCPDEWFQREKFRKTATWAP